MVACVVCLCSVQCCMCRLCLASTSHDTSLRLWDLRMLQDGAEEEEEMPRTGTTIAVLPSETFHYTCL